MDAHIFASVASIRWIAVGCFVGILSLRIKAASLNVFGVDLVRDGCLGINSCGGVGVIRDFHACPRSNERCLSEGCSSLPACQGDRRN